MSERIAEFAVKNRTPAISGWASFADEGNLMTYGPNLVPTGQGTRLLRGQNPQGRQACRPAGRAAHEVRAGDQSKTAKQIGVTIPPNVLARAE